MKQSLRSLFASRGFRLALGIAASGLALYLAFRGVDIAVVRSALLTADPTWIVAALLSVALNTLLKIFRWQFTLGEVGRQAGLVRVAAAFLTGQFLNAIFPVRLGEVSRIYTLGAAGKEYAFVTGTIVIEKTADTAAYILMLIALLLTAPLPPWLRTSLNTTTALFALISAVALLLYHRREIATRLAERVGARLPQGARDFAARHLSGGLKSLELLGRPGRLLRVALLTAAIWFLAICTNWLIMQALGIHLPLTAAMLLLAALQAGINMPSAPAAVGVFELICVMALGAYGVDQATALSYGILLHMVVYLPMTLAGLVSLWYLTVKPAQ